jgi:SAM-dependent methyltransferase
VTTHSDPDSYPRPTDAPGPTSPRTRSQATKTTLSATPPPRSALWAGLELFLVSFLILFFELACIRWFGSTVVFLTFFTNLVLMACFLGVSVGCLAARRSANFMNGFIPLTLLAVGLAYGLLWSYSRFDHLLIDVGGQQSPQQIYFGTDARVKDPSTFVVPIEAIAGVFFVLIALVFLGLGQVMGRRFERIPNRVAAYSADILGSLTGIAVFGALSYWHAPAVVWFVIALGLSLVFVSRFRILQIGAALAILAFVARVDWPSAPPGFPIENVWSPYYQVSYKPRARWIDVNNVGHQGMQRLDQGGSAYMLPYLLNRDSGGPPFGDVLIIGAGSGNDVAAALAQGAKSVDAVEIDPVIQSIGKRHHPDAPYRDPRVHVHLDDGRSFVRKTEKSFDLAIYALVDSLVLHSGYSSIRLESFLFTEQAFRDIKAKLKPGGVFALYNFYRQGWVVGRLAKLAEKVFGTKPLVVSLPYQAEIKADNNQRGYITFLLVGNTDSSVVDRIRSKLAESGSFWLNPEPLFNRTINGYGEQPPPRSDPRIPEFNKIGPARVDLASIDRTPTDDWPFLYLREPAIPALNLRGMAIVGILSLLILLLFAPVRRFRPNGQMFFLGAGFMLLETKGVVHMALLFGSTWMVNSIVFFAILSLILLSNLYVLVVKPRRLAPYYALLIVSLAINGLVPMTEFLALPGVSKVIASCGVVYLPVFFAGVIFASAFRDSDRPDVDFGSNIGGIILGGLTEFASLVVGFNNLLWIAIAYYLLSAWLRPRLTTEVDATASTEHATQGPATIPGTT